MRFINSPAFDLTYDDVFMATRPAVDANNRLRIAAALAVVGIQSSAGYAEGRPLHTSWGS